MGCLKCATPLRGESQYITYPQILPLHTDGAFGQLKHGHQSTLDHNTIEVVWPDQLTIFDKKYLLVGQLNSTNADGGHFISYIRQGPPLLPGWYFYDDMKGKAQHEYRGLPRRRYASGALYLLQEEALPTEPVDTSQLCSCGLPYVEGDWFLGNTIECSQCMKHFHMDCVTLRKKEFNELGHSSKEWKCSKCDP